MVPLAWTAVRWPATPKHGQHPSFLRSPKAGKQSWGLGTPPPPHLVSPLIPHLLIINKSGNVRIQALCWPTLLASREHLLAFRQILRPGPYDCTSLHHVLGGYVMPCILHHSLHDCVRLCTHAQRVPYKQVPPAPCSLTHHVSLPVDVMNPPLFLSTNKLPHGFAVYRGLFSLCYHKTTTTRR